METQTYIGVIREEAYGFSTNSGYEPSLSLECEDGNNVPLGNARYYSYFTDRIGKRIKLTVEELEEVVDNRLYDYDYETLIDEEDSMFEKGTWIPISYDKIKYPEKINDYIERGLLRKIEK